LFCEGLVVEGGDVGGGAGTVWLSVVSVFLVLGCGYFGTVVFMVVVSSNSCFG
jgi:hypothetical protein